MIAAPELVATPGSEWGTSGGATLPVTGLALAETATSLPDPVAVSRAAALLRRMEEIDAALDRIDAGTYGTCVHCGTAIPPERLEFRPHAAGCVSCQQAR